MSNQEMQFEDPQRQRLNQKQEQEQYQSQSINSNPREKQSGHDAQSSEGYAGPGYRGTNNEYQEPAGEPQDPLIAQQMLGAKLRPDARPRRRRRRHWWRPIVATIVILALLSFLTSPITGLFGVHLGWSSSVQNQSFQVISQVNSQAHLIINDNNGNIHIHTGTGTTVQISATIEHGPITGAPNVSMQQTDQSTITADVSDGSGLNIFNSSQVNFDVTVPSNMNLDMHTNLGNIDVQDVTGQVTLSSNAGSITATDTHLSGQGSLTTNAGSVNFSGSIINNAKYDMTTNAGSVDVLLPASSAVQVTASTNAGNIDSDFPGIVVQGNGVGKQASGNIGSNPGASLQISTNAGSISIRQS